MSEITKAVVFTVGGGEYALPIEAVQSIERPGPITPAEEAPAGIAGLCVVKGEAVPLIDVQAIIRSAKSMEDEGQWIMIRSNGRNAGLIVGEAKEIIDLTGTPVRQINLLGFEHSPYFCGVANVNSRLITVFDPAKLLKAAEQIEYPA